MVRSWEFTGPTRCFPPSLCTVWSGTEWFGWGWVGKVGSQTSSANGLVLEVHWGHSLPSSLNLFWLAINWMIWRGFEGKKMVSNLSQLRSGSENPLGPVAALLPLRFGPQLNYLDRVWVEIMEIKPFLVILWMIVSNEPIRCPPPFVCAIWPATK